QTTKPEDARPAEPAVAVLRGETSQDDGSLETSEGKSRSQAGRSCRLPTPGFPPAAGIARTELATCSKIEPPLRQSKSSHRLLASRVKHFAYEVRAFTPKEAFRPSPREWPRPRRTTAALPW